MPFKDDPHKREMEDTSEAQILAPLPLLNLGLEAISEDNRSANEVKLEELTLKVNYDKHLISHSSNLNILAK